MASSSPALPLDLHLAQSYCKCISRHQFRLNHMLVQFVLSQDTGLGHFTHVSKRCSRLPLVVSFFLFTFGSPHLIFFRLAIPISWGAPGPQHNAYPSPSSSLSFLFSLSLAADPPFFVSARFFLPLHQNATVQVPIHGGRHWPECHPR